MVRGQAAKQQGAKSVPRRASIGRVTLAALSVFAGDAGFIAHAIVVDEEEPTVVEGGVVTVVLAALDEGQRFAHGSVVSRAARGPQRLQSGDGSRQVGLGQGWNELAGGGPAGASGAGAPTPTFL